MTRYADRVEADLPALESAVEKFVENGLGHLTWLGRQSDDEAMEQRDDMRREMESLSQATSQSSPQIEEFRDSVLGVKGVSRELDKAVDRVAGALRKVIALIGSMQSFADEGIAVLDGEPEA